MNSLTQSLEDKERELESLEIAKERAKRSLEAINNQITLVKEEIAATKLFSDKAGEWQEQLWDTIDLD